MEKDVQANTVPSVTINLAGSWHEPSGPAAIETKENGV
jgi:hypothetical protein